jgi:ATP-dependent protease HslVU (ClpYQ) peptidase subunit
MTTIVVVKKDGKVAIAADTLTTWGNTKESAEYVINHQKIIPYQDNYLGISGSATLHIAVEDFLSVAKKDIKMENVADIFRFGLKLHRKLKKKYFLRPDTDDDDSFETFRGDILIANPHGIFGLTAYRYVQEYSKFYAHGSGWEYALGAMFAVYDDNRRTAENIAEIGTEAGAEFDDASSLPINCHALDLK